MSIRMRHTRSHTRNRRSHHALSEPRLSTCPDCGKQHIRHQVCMQCGKYRGREVVDVAGITARKLERKERKLKELGEDPTTSHDDKKEELDPQELSKE